MQSFRFGSFVFLVLTSIHLASSTKSSGNDGNHTVSRNIGNHSIDIGSIISQLSQLLKNKTSTTTTPTPTTVTTTTTAAPNINCTCGTGAKPKVSFGRSDQEDDDEEENLDDIDIDTLKSKLSPTDDIRIVHGVTANPGGWPWMAGLILGNNANATNTSTLNLFCGGSLINQQYVVTAAHCFIDFTNTSQIIASVGVVLGTNFIGSKVTNRVIVKISSVRIHPKFNITTLDNDIALLKLAVPVNYTSKIQPICLSQTGTPFENRHVIVAGWGSTNINGSSAVPFLREAGLRTIPNTVCNATEGAPVTQHMICATGVTPQTNSDTCRGDSGGPLMLWKPKTKTYTLIGLTSFGPSICGQQGVPGVYTRVYSYLSFIKEVTNGITFCGNSFTP